jgi:hypothetical protein
LNIENFLTGDKPEFNNIAVCFSRRIEMLAQNESRQKNSPFTKGGRGDFRIVEKMAAGLGKEMFIPYGQGTQAPKG